MLTPESVRVNHAFDQGWIKGIVIDKKCQLSENYFWDANGGAFVVGTPLVSDVVNVAEYIYRDFEVSKINKYKREIIGMWAAFVYRGGKAYCFNDYWGLYDICFHSSEDNTFVVSTSLADVHANVPDARIDEYPFVMDNFQLGAFLGDTMFKEIKRLKREQYLEITECGLNLKGLSDYRYKYAFQNKQQTIQDIVSYAKKLSVKIAARFGKTAVAMTGGFDSRLVFGIFNSAPNNDITLVHGVSSGTEKEDMEIAQNIAKHYHKDFILEDWNNRKGFNLNDQFNTFRIVGYYNYVGLGSKQCYSEYERIGKGYTFYQAGYFCEALRLREWAEQKKSSTFSLTDYVDNYYINKSLKECYANYDEYRNYLVEKYREQLKEIGFTGDENRIPMDYFERFRWIMSRYCDSRSVMMLNSFQFTFPIMSTPFIHEIVLSLPADVIKGGGFQIELVSAMNKELVELFGLHSHRRSYRIKNNKKIPLLTMKNVADYCFMLLPFIKPMMFAVYRKFKYDSTNVRHGVLDEFDQLSVKVPEYLDLTKYPEVPYRLRATMIGLSCVQNEK